MNASTKKLAFGPTMLFCPADRPERYEKALERADQVIIDLEDAVLPEARAEARKSLRASNLDPSRVIVRVNPPHTDDFLADLAVIARTPYRQVMVAKAEDPEGIGNIPHTYELIVLCETARGVHLAPELAVLPNVVGLMWGAEDLMASLGGTSSRMPNGEYRDVVKFARSRVLLAASLAGKAAIDSVYMDIPDLEGLREESIDAAASGFHAKPCIHPSQVDVVRAAYLPSQEEAGWAQRVLDKARSERGVFAFEGRMIDEPVLRHARQVLQRAGDRP